MTSLTSVWAVALAVLLAGLEPARSQDGGVVTIATAGHGGVYLPAGNAICQFVNAERERHHVRCLARASAGSVDNIEALRGGGRAYALVQSDVRDAARRGSRQFEKAGPLPELRAVFSLHAEPFTVVVRADSPIRSFADVAGRRINLGVEGSGMRATTEDVLAAFRIGGAHPAHAADLAPGNEIEALCDGRIEVATFVVGHPSGYVQDAMRACAGRLVPVEGPAVQCLLADAPYYAPATIRSELYSGRAQDVPTLGVRATLVTLASRPEEEVYELIKAVFSNFELWQDGRLMELAGVTDDDGDVFEVVATVTEDGIRVQSESDSIIAPPHSRTSNTTWDPDCMLQSELIDAQNGGVIGLVAEELGEEDVEVAGRQMRAMRYRGITPNAAGQLWYAAGQLVKVRLQVRGETVDYRPVV